MPRDGSMNEKRRAMSSRCGWFPQGGAFRSATLLVRRAGMAVTPGFRHRAFLGEGGFTLIEVMVAIAILVIGIVAVGVVIGSNSGLPAISRSNSISTATMLAQERLEQIRNVQYTASPPPAGVDQITTANFPNEGYGAIAGFPDFRRTVTIQNGVPAAATKTITVQVFFQPVRESGIGPEESVAVATIIAQRP